MGKARGCQAGIWITKARRNLVLTSVLVKVLIPCLDQLYLVLFDNILNVIQLMNVEAIVGGQLDRIQPELGLVAAGFDVCVGWFLAFVAEEATPANARASKVMGSICPICSFPQKRLKSPLRTWDHAPFDQNASQHMALGVGEVEERRADGAAIVAQHIHGRLQPGHAKPCRDRRVDRH